VNAQANPPGRVPYSEAAGELRTLRDILRFAVSRFNGAGLFFGHGYANAFDEAAYLISHALSLPQEKLELFLDARLLAAERDRVFALLQRRIEERRPAAYLTREAWLADHRFYVDERVMIPRSFLAEVLSERVQPWLTDPGTVTSVLDLCTGSGCLAILAALAFPAAVDAADISTEALDVARRNVADYGLEQRITLVQSDLFSALQDCKYDLIVTNPPYVSAASIASLPPEYAHEPRLALSGGSDGLEHLRLILRQASGHLHRDGLLVAEAGRNRESLEAAFSDLPFIWLDTSAEEDYVVFLLRREDLA
jgi:ribosomal protein L3 glutamine methyltransferase